MAGSNGHSKRPLPKGWGSKANKNSQKLALRMVRFAMRTSKKFKQN